MTYLSRTSNFLSAVSIQSSVKQQPNVGQVLAKFEKSSIVGEPTVVKCRLSGGTDSTCILITLKPTPTEHKGGPCCPRTISDLASAGGIWLEAGNVYNVDGVSQKTYVIPMHPIVAKDTQRLSPQLGIGIAFNGVKSDGPVPVKAILGAFTLAPFDTCGGHVNPHAGYHYHAAKLGQNQINGCFRAEHSGGLDSPDQSCDASAQRHAGPPGPPK
jgi:hypothetical protein